MKKSMKRARKEIKAIKERREIQARMEVREHQGLMEIKEKMPEQVLKGTKVIKETTAKMVLREELDKKVNLKTVLEQSELLEMLAKMDKRVK